MTAAALKRIAAGYGWAPKEWHLALAEHIPPMAVVGIFRHAIVTRRAEKTVLRFHSPELVERAAAFLTHVRAVMGPVEIEGPKPAPPMKRAHATTRRGWMQKLAGEKP